MRALEKILETIHFKPENGLVFCDNPKFKHIGELYHIREKAKKMGADAVLFHRKYNENNIIIDSKPVLYIYGKEDCFINSQEHKDIHAKIRGAGDIEVYLIISETRMDIFNARNPAEVKNGNDLSSDKLCLLSEAVEKFNDQRFSAIVFGKQDIFKHQLNEKDSPFHRLLEYLMAAREHLKAKHLEILSETIDKLLIICIFIKFLEGIEDDDGNYVLNTVFEKYGVNDFAEALETKKCIYILDELGNRFAGNIFDGFSDEEKQQIKKADLKSVADFLNAKLDITKKHKQRFLWEQYSFKYLPIELISSVYENLLQKENNTREKGIVYTPPLLVNFLIDELMPLHKSEAYFSQDKFKVLDPCCGSGIFLVAAYKRMLQWWSINHYNKTNEIRFPDKIVCRKIMEENIFGIDIHKTATLITIFSLTIALLDKLEPDEIRNNLKLNSLQNNIQDKDFFEWAVTAKAEDKRFDLVIGNPPLNPKFGITKKEAVSDAHIQHFGISKQDIPNNNFALSFFEGAMSLGKKVCLILPSNTLLYSKKSQQYRNRIFTKFTIEKIFDFTHLRKILFIRKILKRSDNQTTGNTSVCAVLANPAESNGRAIEHTIVKRIVSSEKKIAFEIDHYDRHFVRHDRAIDETKQFIWKTDLLGGGRLFHLIDRLSLLPTLRDLTAIRKRDISSLPYSPNNDKYLELSETEKILQEDVSEYYIHLGRSIREKEAGRKFHKKVSPEQLKLFGKIFCDVLNPIYAENGKSWRCGKFYQTDSLTICQFGYGKNQDLSFQMPDDSDDLVKPLIYNHTSNSGAIFARVCRYYKHLNGYDCVFLIKPNAVCYWLNSIALRDADETFIDLKKAGC